MIIGGDQPTGSRRKSYSAATTDGVAVVSDIPRRPPTAVDHWRRPTAAYVISRGDHRLGHALASFMTCFDDVLDFAENGENVLLVHRRILLVVVSWSLLHCLTEYL